MTYQIPANAYPRNWDEPPEDPVLEEHMVQATVFAGIELQIEDHFDMDNLEEDIESVIGEYLGRLAKTGKARERFFKLQFSDIELNDWNLK